MNVTNSDRSYIYGSMQFYKTQNASRNQTGYLEKIYSDVKKNTLAEKITESSMPIQSAYERMSGSIRKISGTNLLAQTMSGNIKAENEQQEKLQELADIYKSQYPHLVKTEGVAMGFAQAEVAGCAVRTPNGIMMISCNGMEYMDNDDASKSWAVQYPVNASNMYTEIMKAMTDGYIYGDDIEDFSKWKKYFEEKNLEYEKILSDDELAAAFGEKEAETKSDIIVKPDGSRVLVVTMNIGGMETTMSLEISKPTNMQNDHSKQDNENSSTPDAQADTVSDDMSGTVSEA